MLVGAVIAAATGLLTAFSRAADLARDGRHVPLWVTLLEDQTSILMIIALLPAVLWFLRRVPLAEGPLWRWLPLHLAATVAFSLAHVVGMGVLRWAVFGPLGRPHGPFSPLFDWLYEFRKDVLTYGAIVIFASLLWAWRTPPRASAPAGSEDEPLEVKDGARRFFVRPSEIAWIAAAGNYAELHLNGRSLLHRASLAALEARLAAAGFVRIHRAGLVNRSEVAAVAVNAAGDFTVTLRNGCVLAGSRRYRAALSTSMAPA